MIVYLSGNLMHIAEDHVVIKNAGIGYQLFVSPKTLATLPALGQECELYVHHVFREDAQLLFGFLNQEEKQFFVLLLGVSSIGPKSALAILSHINVQQCIDAILFEDIQRLTRLPGIGKKTAERLVLELKDKVLRFRDLQIKTQGNVSSPKIELVSNDSEDAVSALVNLGYSRQEALLAFRKIPHAQDMSIELLVKEGLKLLSESA